MLNGMPCRKEKVIDNENPVQASPIIKNAVLSGQLFGFVKCKLATPNHLWTKFEDMSPIFVNREVPEATVPQAMMDYLN